MRAQNNTTLWIFYPDFREKLSDDLKALKTSLGAVGKKRLAQLATGELHSTVDEGSKPHASEDETDARVERQDGGTYVIKMKLASAPTGRDATEARLLSYQKPCIEVFLSNFTSRLPLPEVITRLKGVFDFNLMELSNSSASAMEELLTHGDDDIDWLVTNIFPMLDAQLLKNQALKVRLWVKERYDRFYDKDEADPSWTKKRRDAHVPKPHIRISGPDSIMEALFATPGVVGVYIEQYLHVSDYMIALDIKTADVERVGSHMQLIKTKLRTSLHDSTFAALVFLSFNLPHLHEIDLDVLIKAWKKAGHMLPINRNDAESRVLRRLKSASSATFFLKKGSPFLPTDFEFLKKESIFVPYKDDDDDDDEGD